MKFKLICLLLFLLPFCLISQNQNIVKPHTESAHTYVKWTAQNPAQWGSFWWKVERSDYKHNGYYYFYVYFSSNSYFNEGDGYGNYKKAISYIENIRLDMYYNSNQPYFVDLPYQLVDWKSSYVAYFYTYTPNPTFKVTYTSVTPYDYSTK